MIMLDVVRFPDPVVPVINFLQGQGFDASTEIPEQVTEHVLVAATTSPVNLVTRMTTYTFESRAQSDIRTAAMGSEVASLLDAWCRSDDTTDTPFRWQLVSLVDSYPDPDTGMPRSVLVCQMSWTGFTG